VMWLCQVILGNFETMNGKGMPLGNLTSQFFANVYLNELDQFVKHVLKERCYVRYVDDFIVVGSDIRQLQDVKRRIDAFLKERLALDLHPWKSRIVNVNRGIDFLGFRVFPKFRLLRKKNGRKMRKKWSALKEEYLSHSISVDTLYAGVQGWCAYASNAATFKMRKQLVEEFDVLRGADLSTIELNQLLKKSQGI
ncbi:RNA-directed DNA polymerase, partial [Candidatus Woesearchaeota archaeon]|nr:RNA-directed DNA polymerase [Candidatus Woesearchaeota archaeon]